MKSVNEILGLPSRIAFGSCAHEDKPQPVLRTVVKHEPDVFVYLGDNIYGDTRDMEVLKAKYGKLGAKPEFRQLCAEVAVLSIWDDHDYGENDAGKEYPLRAESKQVFMDFWQVPADSPRRQRAGIYGAHVFHQDSKRLQLILLDTRTFRDPLKRIPSDLPKDSKLKNAYQPDTNPDKTLLGAVQWRWLRRQFEQPADLRVVCSSIQFGHEYNGWESWNNLPAEQQRMISLIRDTRAGGVLFISGDVHWGEISRRQPPDLYPLYDVTASGLTERWHNTEPNRYRVGNVFRDNHFGLIEIDWNREDPKITLSIVDVPGEVRVSHEVLLSELQPPD